MKRRIGLAARVDAARVVRQVFTGVPTPAAQIDATGERHLVVYYDDFLVVGRTLGMGTVEAEMEARRRLHAQAQGRQQLALGRIDHVEIPRQQVDVQARLAFYQLNQERTEFIRQIGVVVTAMQAFVAIEIPAQDQYLPLGRAAGGGESGKIIGGIDERREARRPDPLPAVATDLKDGRRLVGSFVFVG